MRRRAVLHGDAGFGVHVHRHADGHWFVEKFLAHSDGFKGGHVKGQQALELHLKQRANVAAPRTKGSNPHHRTCSFEAKHFIRVVADVLGDDLNLKKRGHATASVDAIMGLLEPFSRRPISGSFAKQVRAQALQAMYGNESHDITLMPGVARELERCGYRVQVDYKTKAEMIALALSAQKVRYTLCTAPAAADSGNFAI